MTDAATPEQPRTAIDRLRYRIGETGIAGESALLEAALAEAQARPAVASEGLRAFAEYVLANTGLAYLHEQARAALASDAGRSVGALDEERLARALREHAKASGGCDSACAPRIAAAYDAERQGGAGFYDDPELPGNERGT